MSYIIHDRYIILYKWHKLIIYSFSRALCILRHPSGDESHMPSQVFIYTCIGVKDDQTSTRDWSIYVRSPDVQVSRLNISVCVMFINIYYLPQV